MRDRARRDTRYTGWCEGATRVGARGDTGWCEGRRGLVRGATRVGARLNLVGARRDQDGARCDAGWCEVRPGLVRGAIRVRASRILVVRVGMSNGARRDTRWCEEDTRRAGIRARILMCAAANADGRVSTPAQNPTVPPVENPTDRRGDEPQSVAGALDTRFGADFAQRRSA